MGVDAGAEDQKARFGALMKAGSEALAAGDREAAHQRWREAAIIDPYSEQVWLALLRVLDTAEDRRVCLENIIAINPMNVNARRLLRLQTQDGAGVPLDEGPFETADTPKPQRQTQGQPRTSAAGRSSRMTTQGKTAAKPAKRRRSRLQIVLLILIVVVVIGLIALGVSLALQARGGL